MAVTRTEEMRLVFGKNSSLATVKNDGNYKIIIMETIHVNDTNLSRIVACLHQIDFFYSSLSFIIAGCYLLNLLNEQCQAVIFLPLWIYE